jgi:nucleotide-binding universal stress UspA family protein
MSNLTQRRIVVGVGGGERWLAAVDLAAAEATQRRLPLHLLAAQPDLDRTGPQTTLSVIVRRVCTAWPGLAVTGRNVTGDPAEVLVEASRAATLVVIGGGRRPVGRRPVTGLAPVWARVTAHAQCPILVVPPAPATWPGGPVLLGVGMSGEDEPAIEFAFEEADLRQVPLLAAHVWAGLPATAFGGINPFAYDLHTARAAVDRVLAETLAGWADKYPDVQVDRMPMYDADPAATLRDASGLAGLVVVGARRHGRRSSQLLGVVPRTLIQHAGCPVAVVRTGHPG